MDGRAVFYEGTASDGELQLMEQASDGIGLKNFVWSYTGSVYETGSFVNHFLPLLVQLNSPWPRRCWSSRTSLQSIYIMVIYHAIFQEIHFDTLYCIVVEQLSWALNHIRPTVLLKDRSGTAIGCSAWFDIVKTTGHHERTVKDGKETSKNSQFLNSFFKFISFLYKN